MERIIINSTNLAKMFMKNKLESGMTAVDCTVGNGNDTIFIKEIIGDEGMLFGFDIQEEAIANTLARLETAGLDKGCRLYCAGHERIDEIIGRPIDFAVYNLGYLPKYSKEITTLVSTTLESVGKAMDLLRSKGMIIIVAYPGHDEGYEEYIQIKKFLQKINQREFDCFCGEFLNQKNNPPVIFTIEKK